jgi:hypothetical protein
MYTCGATENPARCGVASLGLTTNPAWVRRFSTLHFAHKPVRGQSERFCVVDEPELTGTMGPAVATPTPGVPAEAGACGAVLSAVE